MTRSHWIIVAFLGAAGGAGALAVLLNGEDEVVAEAPAEAAVREGAVTEEVAAGEAVAEEVAEPGEDALAEADAVEEVAVPDETVEESAAAVILPEFDAVRIEPDGSGVIAGRAAPGAIVAVMVGGEAVAEAEADASGAFVAFVDLAPSEAPRVLSLSVDAGAVASESTVIVAPTVAPQATELAMADVEEAEEAEATALAEEVIEDTAGSAAEEADEAVEDVAEAAADVADEVVEDVAEAAADVADEVVEDVAEAAADVADEAGAAEDAVAEVALDDASQDEGAEVEEALDEVASLAETAPAAGEDLTEETAEVAEAASVEDAAAEDAADTVAQSDVAEAAEVPGEDEAAGDLEAVAEASVEGDSEAPDAEAAEDVVAAEEGTSPEVAEAEVAENMAEGDTSPEVAESEVTEDMAEGEASAEVAEAEVAEDVAAADAADELPEVAPQVDVASPGAGFGSSDTGGTVAPEIGAASTADVAATTVAALELPEDDVAPADAPQPEVTTDLGSLAVPELAPAQASLPVLMADADGVRVLQPALAPGADAEVLRTVALDAISYDPSGDVVLSGRATGGGLVRIYLNNAPVVEAAVGADGVWTSGLPGVETGVYTLRVDQVGPDGAVISRIETPFQREERETIAAVLAEDFEAEDTEVAVRTVQPGNTLWGISQERYGEGILYVRVFEANRDLIRDPNLIYPGQILRIPEGEE